MIDRIMGVIKNKRYRARINRAMQYVVCGRSEFTESFDLRVDVVHSGQKRLVVGDHCIVGGSFVFESSQGVVTIGDRTYIGASTFISRSSIAIGNNVTIAWGAWFYDHNSHSIDFNDRRNDQLLQIENIRQGKAMCEDKNWDVVSSKPITVCDDAWIGMNAIILKGVTIGEGAIVGAGSVVVHDVEPFTVVGGNPAVVIKRLK